MGHPLQPGNPAFHSYEVGRGFQPLQENGHLFVQEKMDHLVSELSKGQEGLVCFFGCWFLLPRGLGFRVVCDSQNRSWTGAGSGGIVTRKIIVIEAGAQWDKAVVQGLGKFPCRVFGGQRFSTKSPRRVP